MGMISEALGTGWSHCCDQTDLDDSIFAPFIMLVSLDLIKSRSWASIIANYTLVFD